MDFSTMNLKKTAKETFYYICDTSFARLLLTFLLLHSLHYLSTHLHAMWCLDFGTFGYFTSMIQGHGPICHILLSVSYHVQTNIYQIFGVSLISSGITWITTRTRGLPGEWETQ